MLERLGSRYGLQANVILVIGVGVVVAECVLHEIFTVVHRITQVSPCRHVETCAFFRLSVVSVEHRSGFSLCGKVGRGGSKPTRILFLRSNENDLFCTFLSDPSISFRY